jgi:hypothetical protein
LFGGISAAALSAPRSEAVGSVRTAPLRGAARAEAKQEEKDMKKAALLAASAASFAACATSAEGDRNRDALLGRAYMVRESAERLGRPTPELRAEFRDLSSDVKKWQSQTRRSDMRVGGVSTRAELVGPKARDDDDEDDSDSLCSGFELRGDRICILRDDNDDSWHCEGEGDDRSCVQTCAYDCIWIGVDPEPE